MLEVRGWIKFAEVFDAEKGCDPDTSITFSGNDIFTGDTEQEITKKLLDFCGTSDPDDAETDACEEPGRVDICILENAEGYAASKTEVERWERGEIKLWNASYSFIVENAIRTPYKFK